MPIFIPVDITEDVVKLITPKLWGGYGPGGTDSETLQQWLLKIREDSKRLYTSVETFVDQIANGIPPWAAYHEFMSGRLIVLDKSLASVRQEQEKLGDAFLLSVR